MWITHRALHVTLRTAAWKNPAPWGILLADLARHVANAYEKGEGLDGAKTSALSWCIGKMSDSEQLVIPDAAMNDKGSFELLRVWIANKGQHVSLRTAVWKDPAAWGLVLARLSQATRGSRQDFS